MDISNQDLRCCGNCNNYKAQCDQVNHQEFCQEWEWDRNTVENRLDLFYSRYNNNSRV